MSRKSEVLTAIIATCMLLLTACKHKVNDAATVSDIQAKLLQDHVLNDYYVRVESRGGAVTISGTAPSATAKQAIDNLSGTAHGTTSFTDKMTVAQAPVMASAASNTTNEATVPMKPPHPAIARTESKSHVGMATAAPPTVTLKATPSLIMPGKVAVLTWTSQHAASLDLEPGIGRVKPEGSRPVSPQTSTTYTLTATGEAGRATATAQVSVWNAVPPPRISASEFPASIQKGLSARLSWTSQNATSVDIEPGVGRVVPSGSTIVNPSQTTQYTLTATGQGGTQTTTALVNVAAGPQSVTIPPGTDIPVTMTDSIDSAVSSAGQTFAASITSTVVIGNQVVIPQGANARVRLEEVHRAGHFKGSSLLKVDLASVTVNGIVYNVQTNSYQKEGAARGKNTAETVGAASGIGALIGGILGGGKGAGIGAVIGGAAGTAKQAATHGQQAKILGNETELRSEKPREGDAACLKPLTSRHDTAGKC